LKLYSWIEIKINTTVKGNARKNTNQKIKNTENTTFIKHTQNTLVKTFKHKRDV